MITTTNQRHPTPAVNAMQYFLNQSKSLHRTLTIYLQIKSILQFPPIIHPICNTICENRHQLFHQSSRWIRTFSLQIASLHPSPFHSSHHCLVCIIPICTLNSQKDAKIDIYRRQWSNNYCKIIFLVYSRTNQTDDLERYRLIKCTPSLIHLFLQWLIYIYIFHFLQIELYMPTWERSIDL